MGCHDTWYLIMALNLWLPTSKSLLEPMESSTAVYHPATNSEAERFVRTFNEAMKASRREGLTFSHRLQNFLLAYWTTAHATTGVPPCNLVMGRTLRTQWDLLKPSTADRVDVCQERQKRYHDSSIPLRIFHVGQKVMARNF